jgi:hypothetical protein
LQKKQDILAVKEDKDRSEGKHACQFSEQGMYEGKSKSNGTFKEAHLLQIYRKEINITFQRNPARLQNTGSSVSQVF